MSKVNINNIENKESKEGKVVTAKNPLEQMNHILADYQVFQQIVHNAHWNISGINFLHLHAFFDEIYQDALEKIDELAERIKGHGGVPFSKFKDYLEHTCFQESDILDQPIQACTKIIRCIEHIDKELEVIVGMTSSSNYDLNDMAMSFIRDNEVFLYKLKQLVK